MNTLYPAIEPYNEFKLNVTDLHTIHVEESGNPEGKPVVFLHGGPGGGIEPIYRQYFSTIIILLMTFIVLLKFIVGILN